MTRGTTTAISDGSFKKGYSTSCSILHGSTNTTQIILINTVPGPTDSQSAYRSELAGISGSLLIIQAICKRHHIQNGCITIGLDGQSAMKSVSQKQQPKPQQPDFDLLCDIRTKLLRLPISVKWTWIKGHEDDHISFARLSPIAQDNVIANNIAKTYVEHLITAQQPIPNLRFTDESLTLYLGPNKQTHLNKQCIYDYLTQPDIMEYWSQR